MARASSDRPPSLKKVLALVRKSARANERASAHLPEFNRLFRFYSQLADEELFAASARDERPTEAAARDRPNNAMAAELAQRNARQQATQTKYRDYPGYYALLASFYTAFIAPLEQDIAIAEACEELPLTELEVGPDSQRVLIPVASFNQQAAQAALAGITGTF